VLPDGPDVGILERHAPEPRLLANHALPLRRVARVELVEGLADGIYAAITLDGAVHGFLEGCGAH
jgi:hypothetical protein